jgi:hypothetical protein
MPVAVEKLLPAKFAKIKSRQEAPQSIFSGRVGIFYPPNFDRLRRKGSFSTATPVLDSYVQFARHWGTISSNRLTRSIGNYETHVAPSDLEDVREQ